MIHPPMIEALARARVADAERERQQRRPWDHQRQADRPLRQDLVNARRVVGQAVVAIGQRIIADVPDPQPRGAPPGAV